VSPKRRQTGRPRATPTAQTPAERAEHGSVCAFSRALKGRSPAAAAALLFALLLLQQRCCSLCCCLPQRPPPLPLGEADKWTTAQMGQQRCNRTHLVGEDLGGEAAPSGRRHCRQPWHCQWPKRGGESDPPSERGTSQQLPRRSRCYMCDSHPHGERGC
jgi:hypothetical protein